MIPSDVTCPLTSQPSGGAPSDSHIKLKPVEITVILAAIFPITANLWLWINALHGHSHVISLQTQTPLFAAEYCCRNDKRDTGIKRGLFGNFQQDSTLLNLFRCLSISRSYPGAYNRPQPEDTLHDPEDNIQEPEDNLREPKDNLNEQEDNALKNGIIWDFFSHHGGGGLPNSHSLSYSQQALKPPQNKLVVGG